MKHDVNLIDEQPLVVENVENTETIVKKKEISYITSPNNFEEPNLTAEDYERVVWKEAPPLEIPKDRQITTAGHNGGLVLLLPKDMKAALKRIENAGKPKTRIQKIKSLLLNLLSYRLKFTIEKAKHGKR